MNIVIVESVAKAKAINKYLGPKYKVLASYGHVRDLPSKDGSVELRLEDEAAGSAKGLGKILATSKFKLGKGLKAYFGVVRDELRDDYRSQFARLAAKTQPLG